MSLLNKTTRFIVRDVLYSQKRYNTREAIRKYVEPNKLKKFMLAATQPYRRRVYARQDETCATLNRIDRVEMLPIEKILAKELLEELSNSQYTLLIQYNDTPFQSDRVYRNTLTKLGAKFIAYNNMIYRDVFRTLGHESTNYLFVARNALVAGQIESLPKSVKALRKMPSLILLAGFIDNHLYDVDTLNNIANFGSLEQSRVNLVGTLETPGIELASLLERLSENTEDDGVVGKSD